MSALCQPWPTTARRHRSNRMHPDLKQNLIHYLKKESKKSNLSKQKKMDIETMVGLSNRCLAKEKSNTVHVQGGGGCSRATGQNKPGTTWRSAVARPVDRAWRCIGHVCNVEQDAANIGVAPQITRRDTAMVVAMAAIRTRMLVLTLVANARQRDLFINHNLCLLFF